MNFDKRANYYKKFRKADHRLVQKIIELLSLNKNSIVADIGAGTGNYSLELMKCKLFVYAIEPAKEMINQCENKDILWINSYAEKINLPNDTVDGAIIINAIHHFKDLRKSLEEIKRIVKNGPLLIFTFDPDKCEKNWIYDYWPQLRKYVDDNYVDINYLKLLLKDIFSTEVDEFIFNVPSDFQDIFAAATWKRPCLLLNSDARCAMSLFNYLNENIIEEGLIRLEMDLKSGVWHKLNPDIISYNTYDVGCRFLRLNII